MRELFQKVRLSSIVNASQSGLWAACFDSAAKPGFWPKPEKTRAMGEILY